MLFDTGPEADLYLRNCRNLGVSLADAEAIAVSHGHWDHTGAMLEVLAHMTRVNGGHEVPCHANPGMFLDRGAILSNGKVAPFQPVASTDELTSHGAAIVNAYEQRVLSDDWFYLSGEIPRVSSFEKGRVDHLCRKSPQDAWQPDPLIMDERYLAVRIKNKGLMVFSACSHAGIINVLMDVRERFANLPIYGVFGGFHLASKAWRGSPDPANRDRTQGIRPEADHAGPLHGMARRACTAQRVRRRGGGSFRRGQPVSLLKWAFVATVPLPP